MHTSLFDFISHASGKSNTRPGVHHYVQNARPFFDRLKPRLPRYRIPASQMIVMEFVVPVGGSAMLTLVHTGRTQDSSIQAWISTEPDGSSVLPMAKQRETWTPNRLAFNPLTIFDRAGPAPSSGWSAGLPPGRYFLNVLNVSNEPNEVAFWS
jgi:hypothetical protein